MGKEVILALIGDMEIALMGRPNCEINSCRERAVLRKFFVDEDGNWTWLCPKHSARITNYIGGLE